MEEDNYTYKGYLPYLSKNPILLKLYEQWKALEPKNLLSQEDMRVFGSYRDAGFMVMWFHLFPDIEQSKGSGWFVVKQRAPSKSSKIPELRPDFFP